MRLNRVFANTGIAAALVLGIVSVPSQAEALSHAGASATCYVYAPAKGLSIYAGKKLESEFIGTYWGTRLTPQRCEYEETGGRYRCVLDGPWYTNWAPVIYKGVKRYTPMECSAGWGT